MLRWWRWGFGRCRLGCLRLLFLNGSSSRFCLLVCATVATQAVQINLTHDFHAGHGRFAHFFHGRRCFCLRFFFGFDRLFFWNSRKHAGIFNQNLLAVVVPLRSRGSCLRYGFFTTDLANHDLVSLLLDDFVTLKLAQERIVYLTVKLVSWFCFYFKTTLYQEIDSSTNTDV